MNDLDDLESYRTLDGVGKPGRPRGKSFGTIGQKVMCAGFAGETCKRPGVKKGGKLWYCHAHAPRGSEG